MPESPIGSPRRCRIVLTGGPGGGKTTAADLFRRELGERVVVVPESATILFGGGFPRSQESDARRATQRAIFHVQRSLEDIQSARYPDRILLCDRGTIDGAAYWPDGADGFFTAMSTTLEQEISRYDAVVFFETAAVSGIAVEGGNPIRIETVRESFDLDRRLRNLWERHPRFMLVPHTQSFFQKVTFGLSLLQSVVAQFDSSANLPQPADP